MFLRGLTFTDLLLTRPLDKKLGTRNRLRGFPFPSSECLSSSSHGDRLQLSSPAFRDSLTRSPPSHGEIQTCMQSSRAMAVLCVGQITSSTLSCSRALAGQRIEGLRCLTTSSPILTKPWFRQAGAQALISTSARPGYVASRGKFHLFPKAISTTTGEEADAEISTESTEIVKSDVEEVPAKLKTKNLTKQVKHIMSILNTEALAAATKDKNIPTLRPGDVVQLRVEVPENKRRISLLRGIVIAIHNAGINSTFRIRRVLAGVGVEMVFPLYSPNIKEFKVIDKRKARRAKLYYLRDKIARMSSC